MNTTIPAFFCEESYVDVILASDKFKVDDTNEYLIIGFPGADGIEFRIKKNGDMTVFAYYPYENIHIKVADTPQELIRKWKEGSLKV